MNLFVEVIIWIAYILSIYFSVFFLLVYIDKKKLLEMEKSILTISAAPLVSILVPAYNEEKTILKTLKSIEQLHYPKSKLDVIVINDGSTDDTEKIAKAYIKDKLYFRLITHHNKGKAASLNEALNLVQGDFFACLDADSFVEADTLRKMLALYEKEGDPSLAIITPAMKVSTPTTVLQKIQWLEYIVIILIARLTSHLDSLYVAPGPFSLYRTEIIKNLGGFDEHNVTEDQEIAYRVQQRNYSIKQCFDGYVYTTAPGKIRPFYLQRRRWYLGSLMCLHKYKKMIANRKYGDFGIFQMLKNVLAYFLSVTGITIAVYFLLIPMLRWLQEMIVIRFNIWPYLTHFSFKIGIMDILLADFKKGFVIAFLFSVSLLFFYLAHRNANEKINKFGWIPLLPYFLFYYLLKGVILLLSFWQFTKKQRLKW